MSEGLYIERGPVVIVPDPMNPNFFQVVRNPEWTQIPEVCSFTDFICWNYAEDYERLLRKCIEGGLVPPSDKIGQLYNRIEKVRLNYTRIHRIYLHLINEDSFRMDTIVVANMTICQRNGREREEEQWYRVKGTYSIYVNHSQ